MSSNMKPQFQIISEQEDSNSDEVVGIRIPNSKTTSSKKMIFLLCLTILYGISLTWFLVSSMKQEGINKKKLADRINDLEEEKNWRRRWDEDRAKDKELLDKIQKAIEEKETKERLEEESVRVEREAIKYLILPNDKLKAKEEKVKAITQSAMKDFENGPLDNRSNDILVIYSYSETSFSRANILFFIAHGLHAYADFLFVINGESDIDLLIPEAATNIKVIKRNNTCFDLGSSGQILNADDQKLVKKYKKFILMNSSLRGPFLPTWATECWTDLFVDKISDEIKLVGSTYGCGFSNHVQSMVLATDRIGLETLLKGDDDKNEPVDFSHGFNWQSLKGLSFCATNKFSAIEVEVSLTNVIRKAGYKVAVLMTEASSSENYYEECPGGGWEGVHPYEIVFVKANFNYKLDYPLIQRMTEWHNGWGYNSWKICIGKK